MKGKFIRLGVLAMLGISMSLAGCNGDTPPSGEESSNPPISDSSNQPTPVDSSTSGNSSTSTPDPDIIDGPETTDDSGLGERDDDPDNPYHKPDINPTNLDQEEEPRDVNIYFMSTVADRDMIWAWGNNTSGAGIVAPHTGVTVEGISGYTFNAVYMAYNQYYYDYSSWDMANEGYFYVDRTSFFTGLILRNSTDSSTQSVSVDLSGLTLNTEGSTDVYIVEKGAVDVGVFTSVSEVSAYLGQPIATPKEFSEETEAQDFNIYIYSAAGSSARDMIYFWDSDGNNGRAAVSKTGVNLDGVDSAYTFNALYINYGTYYNFYKGWSDASTAYYSFSANNTLKTFLFRNNDGSSQTSDISLSAVTVNKEGPTNIYLVEKDVGSVQIYTTIEDVSSALGGDSGKEDPDEPVTDEGKTEAEASDFNIYFYSPVEKASRNYAYLWNSTSKSLTGSLIETYVNDLTVEGIDGYSFTGLFMKYGKAYDCYAGWTTETEGTFTLSAEERFDRLIMRNVAGTAQTSDITLPGDAADIYVIEKSEGNIKVFTDVESVNSFLAEEEQDPVWPIAATEPSDFNIYTYCVWGNQYRNKLYAYGTHGINNIDIELLNDENPSKEVSISDSIAQPFNAIYLTYNTPYYAYSGWNGTGTTTFRVNDTSYFDYLILRTSDAQTIDNAIKPLSEIPTDEAGHKNVYLIETAEESEGKKVSKVFYTAEDVVAYFSN